MEQVEQRLLLAVHSCLSVEQEAMDEGNVGDGQGTIVGNPAGREENTLMEFRAEEQNKETFVTEGESGAKAISYLKANKAIKLAT